MVCFCDKLQRSVPQSRESVCTVSSVYVHILFYQNAYYSYVSTSGDHYAYFSTERRACNIESVLSVCMCISGDHYACFSTALEFVAVVTCPLASWSVCTSNTDRWIWLVHSISLLNAYIGINILPVEKVYIYELKWTLSSVFEILQNYMYLQLYS